MMEQMFSSLAPSGTHYRKKGFPPQGKKDPAGLWPSQKPLFRNLYGSEKRGRPSRKACSGEGPGGGRVEKEGKTFGRGRDFHAVPLQERVTNHPCGGGDMVIP
jgi:hypothetical protein